MSMVETQERHLVTIAPETALTVFTTEGAIDPLLEHVRREIDAFVPNVTTAKGRAEIKSMARRVADSKVYLESVGKKLADEQKEIPKKIDAARKRIRDTLDKWRDEVRAPVSEWEDAEEARIKRHNDAIGHINFLTCPTNDIGQPYNARTLRECLAWVEAVEIGPHCEEFEAEYARMKDGSIKQLKETIATREKYEAEQVELARLRKEAEARAERDRIAAIERAAAEKARAEAESAAKAEREAAERRELDLKLAAERAEREAKEREGRIIREAEEARQREALAAAREKLDSERRELELRRAKEDAERAAAETEARVKREAELVKAREEAETRKREEDKAHRAKVNNAAMAALVQGGLSEGAAKTAVTLNAKREVPGVTISY